MALKYFEVMIFFWTLSFEWGTRVLCNVVINLFLLQDDTTLQNSTEAGYFQARNNELYQKLWPVNPDSCSFGKLIQLIMDHDSCFYVSPAVMYFLALFVSSCVYFRAEPVRQRMVPYRSYVVLTLWIALCFAKLPSCLNSLPQIWQEIHV